MKPLNLLQKSRMTGPRKLATFKSPLNQQQKRNLMPKKILVVQHEGSEFLLENTWFSGAKLFQDNKLIAKNNALFAINKNKPLMSATVILNGAEHLIEAFCYAYFTVKLQLKVNGEYIAGDKF